MKRLVAISLALLSTSTSVFATPFYRETFGLCAAKDGESRNAGDLTSWNALRAGSTVGKVGYLKVNAPGSPNQLSGFNSSAGPVAGGAFWVKETTGLSIFTEEFSFDLSSLTQIQYEQRLSGSDRTKNTTDGTQLALKIGGTWYISDQVFPQDDRGDWETITIEPRKLTYGTTPNRAGKGPLKPDNSGITLPASGTVSAFGVFLTAVTGRVRIDNFTLLDSSTVSRTPDNAAAICTPVTPSKPGSTPTPTPSGTPPVSSTPTGTTGGTGGTTGSNSGSAGTFCSGTSARALGKVKASNKLKKNMVLSVTGFTAEAARDRAILALILLNNIRIDGLVNVTVGDYYTTGTLPVINASGISKQTIAVKPRVKPLIDAYLALSGLAVKPAAPLFPASDAYHTLTNRALCTADLRKLVKRAAKKIKAQKKVTIGS